MAFEELKTKVYFIPQQSQAFGHFFNSVSGIHNYRTRSATKNNFHIPKPNTNYGKSNIRFKGAKTWNAIEESLRGVESLKYNLKLTVLKSYQ